MFMRMRIYMLCDTMRHKDEVYIHSQGGVGQDECVRKMYIPSHKISPKIGIVVCYQL